MSSARVGVIQASDLAHVPFLLCPKRSNIRTIIDQFFQEINIAPRVVMEAEDSEAIKGLVESGFGYSILPHSTLSGVATAFFIPTGWQATISPEVLRWPWYAATTRAS